MNRDSVHVPGIFSVIACFLAVLPAPSVGQATTTQSTNFFPTPKTFLASTGVQGLVDSTEPRAEKRHSRFEIFGYDRLFGQFCRYDGSRNRNFTRFHFEDGWRCWAEPPVLVATSGGRVRRIFQGTCGSSATGFDFMHARYYSPFLARFVSVDPVGGTVGSSQSWNRYSYVLNNPVKLVDPDGEKQRVSYLVAGDDAAAHSMVRIWDDENPDVDRVYSVYSETLSEDYGFQREPSQLYSLGEVRKQYSEHGIEVTEFVLDLSDTEVGDIATGVEQVYRDSTEHQLGDFAIKSMAPASCVTACADAIQPNLNRTNRIQIPNPMNYVVPNVLAPAYWYAIVLRNQGVVESENLP